MKQNINLMKSDVASTSQLVGKLSKFSIGDHAASQEPTSARGEHIPLPLPNKLSINFQSSDKDERLATERNDMNSKRLKIEDLNQSQGERGSVPYAVYNSHVNAESLEIGEIPVGEQVVSPRPQVTQRPKVINVRKLLKFRNGLLNPQSKEECEAIEHGKQEFSEAVGKLDHDHHGSKHLPFKPKPRANPGGIGRITLNKAQSPQTQQLQGFNLQNRLVAKSNQRSAKKSNFNSLLFHLSQPESEDLVEKSKAFFQEDLQTSAKFRENSKESKERMSVRFDGPLVMARSICGSRNTFQAYLSDKMREGEHHSKLRRAANMRKSTLRMSSIGLAGVGKPHTSEAKTRKKQYSQAGQGTYFRNPFASESHMSSASKEQQFLDEFKMFEKSKMQVIERNSENDSQRKSDDSVNSDDNEQFSPRKMRAMDKLSLYQKGWQGMNRALKRGQNRQVGFSLIDQQDSYVSPRNDCLSSFYETAQQSVSMCPNDKRRSMLIEDTFRKEVQKFDHDHARKSWVGSLRDDKFMYLQTTKNSRNALHCHIATQSKDLLPYSTRSTLNYRFQRPEDDEDVLNSSQVNTSMAGEQQLPNRLAQTQVSFDIAKRNLIDASGTFSPSASQHQQQQQPQETEPGSTSRRRVARKKTTMIFDGAMLEKMRQKVPVKTYRSKRNSVDRTSSNAKRQMYLPQVAIAIKMHQHTKNLIEMQQEEDQCKVIDLELDDEEL